MTEKLKTVPLITRREIEASMAAPLIDAYAEEMGVEKAREIAGGVIIKLAEDAGRQLAHAMGGNDLKTFAETLSIFTEGDSLELEILEASDTKLSYNVTRCRYAETYRELGLIEHGATLSCNRDWALVKGFNPDIRLTRTQTIMEGAAFCDFRYEAD